MGIKNYSIDNTAFTIMADNTLTDLDRKVLTHCYLPIIGDKALSIYMTLYTMLDSMAQESNVLNHSQLVKLTGIPKTKFAGERIKLEAVGLLSTYYKDSHFIYVLKRVLSPYEFFNNNDLVRVLSSVIGIEDIDALAYNFLLRKLDPNKFENITASFDDVFDACLETEANYFGIGVDTINNGIVINNKKFNIDHFIILIDAMDLLDKNILHDDSFLNLIKRYAFLYGLDVEQLKEAVKLSVNMDKTIDLEQLEMHVKRIYDNRNQNVVFIKKREVVRSNNKLINELNTRTPNEIVKNKFKTELTSSEISMFDKLLRETNVSIGVLNVCIIYVVSEKNGEIPSYNYFLKVINTWIRAGITNAEQAINYINNGTDPKKSQNTKTKKVKQVPSWYKKQEQNENKNDGEELNCDILDFFKPNE